jgi:hypothetical protein
MQTLSLKGACDTHIHTAPCIFDRLGDDFEMARRARDAGMRAIVLKSHHEPTYGRAYLTQQIVPGIQVFGGVVLDHHVGGVNPSAVEPCIKVGGKIVWMPTYHALAQATYFGSIGTYGWMGGEFKTELKPLTILDDKGKIIPEAMIIMQMCKDADIILAGGHLLPEELLKLAKAAKDMNYTKFMINHPFFKPPALDYDTIGELIKLGAWIELCSGSLCQIPGYAKITDFTEVIKRYGVSHIVLATDGGHNRKPWPTEDLRVCAQQLNYKGVSLEDIDTILCKNYTYLLNLN